MALISCKECGREVSDQAAACPACGAPVAQAAPAPEQNSGCSSTAKWLVILFVGVPLVLFFGSAFIAGTMEAFSDDRPSRPAPYTGRLKIDHGTEYVLEESPSTVGGACSGWNTLSLQKPGQPSTGMRELLCWRLVGDTVEVTSRDGQQTPPAKRSVFTD